MIHQDLKHCPVDCVWILLIVLQATLVAWSAHMAELRDAHSCLNFFTTDQLVLLAGQLAGSVHGGRPLSVEASMLLRLIAGGKFRLGLGIHMALWNCYF